MLKEMFVSVTLEDIFLLASTLTLICFVLFLPKLDKYCTKILFMKLLYVALVFNGAVAAYYLYFKCQNIFIDIAITVIIAIFNTAYLTLGYVVMGNFIMISIKKQKRGLSNVS